MRISSPNAIVRWPRPLSLASVLILALFAGSCTDQGTSPFAPAEEADAPSIAFNLQQAPDFVCGDQLSVTLLAGQTADAGTVTISNDEEKIYVTFSAAPGWMFTETHLAVVPSTDEFPTTKSGSPKVGHFPFSEDHDPPVTEFTYQFEYDLEPGTELFVAAHAAMVNEQGESESAWGEGTRFRERGDWSMYFSYTVQECGAPSPGEDIVVFNDINPFDNNGMSNPNNRLMMANLVNYATSRPRGAGTVVLWDNGRRARCGGYCSPTSFTTSASVIQGEGYTVQHIQSSSGTLVNIAPNVKVVFLWNPLVPYTRAEINALKSFAEEGGRVVFIGEWDGYYGSGIALENQFLLDMGAVMTNIGQAIDCGYNTLPATSLRPHQVTTGMTGATIACASVIVPGPNDYAFMYDRSNTRVLAGVAKIDPTPLPVSGPEVELAYELLRQQMAEIAQVRFQVNGELDAGSPTGY